MKTLFKFTMVFLMIIATIACKNNTSTETQAETTADANSQMVTETPKPNDTKPGWASLSFKMDGTLVEATNPGTMAIFSPSKKEVNIRANTPKGVFSIIMGDVEGNGTYTVKNNSDNGAGLMMTSKMFEVKKSGTPFTVTINNVEEIKAINAPEAKAIRGTFEGKLMDEEGNSMMITEGKFSSQ